MRLETFRGLTLTRVAADARDALGDDVMIVHTRTVRTPAGPVIEIVVATTGDVERFRRRVEPAPLPPARTALEAKAGARPFVLALVGPTGAGKTTTAAKLASHPSAFGGRRVGLLTLDTYRAAAVAQLETHAELARLPLEVVYGPREVEGAMKRLSKCDAVIVDTPGWSPRHPERNDAWRTLLALCFPDETHLVMPAGVRADVAANMVDALDDVGLTHLLVTKLDEVPHESGVAELAAQVALPARWVADGQEIPADLRPAGARLLASLGVQAPAPVRAFA